MLLGITVNRATDFPRICRIGRWISNYPEVKNLEVRNHFILRSRTHKNIIEIRPINPAPAPKPIAPLVTPVEVGIAVEEVVSTNLIFPSIKNHAYRKPTLRQNFQ